MAKIKHINVDWGIDSRKNIPYWEGKKNLKLNLGCGDKVMDGYVNIDTYCANDEVIPINLEKGKLPFEDGSVDEVWADNVLEHITNFIPLMNEINRVMSPGSRFLIQVPFVPHVEAFQDPTHVRFFTERSFDYFVGKEFLYEAVGKNYGIVPFRQQIKQFNSFIMLVTLYK